MSELTLLAYLVQEAGPLPPPDAPTVVAPGALADITGPLIGADPTIVYPNWPEYKGDDVQPTDKIFDIGLERNGRTFDAHVRPGTPTGARCIFRYLQSLSSMPRLAGPSRLWAGPAEAEPHVARAYVVGNGTITFDEANVEDITAGLPGGVVSFYDHGKLAVAEEGGVESLHIRKTPLPGGRVRVVYTYWFRDQCSLQPVSGKFPNSDIELGH